MTARGPGCPGPRAVLLPQAVPPYALAAEGPRLASRTLGGDAERDQLVVQRVRQPPAVLAAVVGRRTGRTDAQAAGVDLPAELHAEGGIASGREAAVDDAAGLVRAPVLAQVLRLAVQIDAAGECDARLLAALVGTAPRRDALVVQRPREVLAALLAGGWRTVLAHALVERVSGARHALLGVTACRQALAQDLDRVFRAPPPAPMSRAIAERFDAARSGIVGQLLTPRGIVAGSNAPIVE